VGGLLVGGLLAFLPGTAVATPTPTATPTPYPSSAPTPVASAPTPAASAMLEASASADPSPSAEAEPSATTGAEAFGVGQPAPALVVPKVGGGTIDLASFKGKPVWVNFMATWCPSCIDELPLMAGFAARYEDTGLVVVPVDVREDKAAVAAFFKGMGVKLSVGLDSDGAAQDAWGALALPVHFWIDKEGVVRDAALGGIGPDVMATGLESILPGVTVTP
jgi:thiol-disulfide isomerase/thioredoxin